MNIINYGLITLLKSAVTQHPLVLPEDFELEQAMPLIKKHNIVPLAYVGAIQCGISRQDPVMQQLFAGYCRALLANEKQMHQLQCVFREFDENGIDYLPLKGANLKLLYPKPELRIMGDADILIRMEQYPKIISIMQHLAFHEERESDHELIWRSKSLFLELHKRIIPSYNKDFYSYFGDGWKLARSVEGTRYSMIPEDEFVYLFTHFTKHYRDGGIGCRHVLDLWVYRRANPELDEGYIRNELAKLRLEKFYDNTSRMIAVWFEGESGNEITDFMTEFIFSSGSWGQRESSVIASIAQRTKWSALGFSGKLTYLWENLFPSLEVLRSKYSILKKMPVLLPLVWLIRPFYKFLFEKQSLKEKRNEMALINTDRIAVQRDMLKLVGLE